MYCIWSNIIHARERIKRKTKKEKEREEGGGNFREIDTAYIIIKRSIIKCALSNTHRVIFHVLS